jgi:hypothetical protein
MVIAVRKYMCCLSVVKRPRSLRYKDRERVIPLGTRWWQMAFEDVRERRSYRDRGDTENSRFWENDVVTVVMTAQREGEVG